MFLLEPVGLGRAENDVYLALLDAHRATVDELAARVGGSGPAVLATLARLSATGLVNRVGPAEYMAVSPEVSVAALVRRRKSDLARLQERIDDLARLRPRGPVDGGGCVELLDGDDAVLTGISRLQFAAKSEVLVVDAPPYLGGACSPNIAELAQLASGIRYRVVYAPEALATAEDADHMRRCAEAGEQARVLADGAMKMAIADRSMAILPCSYSHPDPSRRWLVRPSALLDAVVACFESQWARAVPISAPAAEVSDRDRELLALLSSGMKDRTIARAMGITDRTVGRRVTELMRLLGAETRFQAGVLAARRGWL
ncbi:helix-turn-helix transcriptional regulator [Actinokineospora fastidiosa]|uniref:Transcriptional regulator n=1 Tax=Actinokineospora fastidiosa TaxID=1816 RepID=A0A918GKW7_9PSEU|nr:LuxR family transcriptional regulator [Actinokineospora fastidiosa]GGS43782.1 transcriptional regulator [Actinokineospora fastidiosa]